jgi:hypothetical protein
VLRRRDLARVSGLALVVAGALLGSCSLASLSAEYGVAQDDAATSDGGEGGSDAQPLGDGARCDPQAAFGTPEAVKGLPDDVSAFGMIAGESLAYYVQEKPGQLFFARVKSDGEIEPGTPMAIPDHGKLSAVSLTDDGTKIFFASLFDLYVATGDAGGSYAGEQRVAQLAGQPYVDEAHGLLYASRYVEAGTLDRSIARMRLDAALGSPFEDLDLGPGSSSSPVAGNDGTSVYFENDRERELRATDIYVAVSGRDPVAVPNINSGDNDQPLWLSRDGCHLYLASFRETLFSRKVYIARRGAR